MPETPPEAAGPTLRLAVIGDLHDAWNDFDVRSLNGAGYDAIVFVGDLGRGDETSRRISRSIARLGPPTLVLPGNADAPHAARLRAELSLRRGLDRLFGETAEAAPGERLCGVQLAGYSLHRPPQEEPALTLVAGRPFSLGGPELSFAAELEASFGVKTLADSTERLVALVEQVETEALVFVSHNGPAGLGDRPDDLWGCDFRPETLDWGDPDLAVAIEHARRRGRRVLAVVAGHMHHRLQAGQGERRWLHREDGTLYVNPARVPRIERREGGQTHHHVSLRVGAGGASAEPVFWLG